MTVSKLNLHFVSINPYLLYPYCSTEDLQIPTVSSLFSSLTSCTAYGKVKRNCGARQCQSAWAYLIFDSPTIWGMTLSLDVVGKGEMLSGSTRL